MTFEFIRLGDRAIRQVLCLFSHMKGAKLRLRQTTFINFE